MDNSGQTMAPSPAPDVREAMRRRGLAERIFTVVATEQVTPRMRRVSLAVEGNEPFEPAAGQDVVLMLPGNDGVLGRRHYTIRRYDPATRLADIDFVLHGLSTPGPRWALGATPGASVTGYGPRGRNILHPDAAWRLFVGDETCIPAILAMLETLPPGSKATALIEVADDDERQPLESAANVTVEWLSRGGPPVVPSSRLIARLAEMELPAGVGHAYVIGETSTVRAQRHQLLERGVPKERIFAEGYWRPDRIGGHDHV